METRKRRWNAAITRAVMAASIGLPGCSGMDLGGNNPLSWLAPEQRPPMVGPILVTSISADPAGRKAAPAEPPDPRKTAAIGGLGGVGAGLAACAPTLVIPLSYLACATLGALVGTAGGALLGSALADQTVAGRNIATILADLPPDEQLAAAFRKQVVERVRSELALEAVDAGATQSADGSLDSQLVLEVARIRGERVDAYRFRFVVSLRTALIERERAGNLRDLEHRSDPLPAAVGHAEAVAVAQRTLEVAFRVAADLVVAEQLHRDALVPRKRASDTPI